MPIRTSDTSGIAAPSSYVFAPFANPLDWLDVTFDVPKGSRIERPFSGEDTIPLSDRLVLSRLPGRSRVFDRLDELIDRRTDRKLAVVRSCPHSAAIMPMNRVQVKVENEALYNYTWKETLDQVQEALGWNYQSVSRIDLAADGYGFLRPFHDAARGAVSYGGRADFVVRWSNGRVKAAELGIRSANKFGRIYGKSKELQLSGKLYIADYWKDKGAEPGKDVDRCELAVKGVEVRRYFKDEKSRDFLEYLTEPKYRATVFESLASTFVRFRTGESGDRSRDRQDLLSWDWSGITEESVERRPRAKRIQDLGLNALKMHIRISYLVHYTTGSARHLSTAQEMAEALDLTGWMKSKKSIWKREAEKMVAAGFYASTLFDRLQDCDSAFIDPDVGILPRNGKDVAAKPAHTHAIRPHGNQRSTGRNGSRGRTGRRR